MQGGGDLPIRLTLSHKGRDLSLARSEVVTDNAATADSVELVPGLFRPQQSSDVFEDPERCLECLAGLVLAECASLKRAKDQECPTMPERVGGQGGHRGDLLECGDRFIQLPTRTVEHSATSCAI